MSLAVVISTSAALIAALYGLQEHVLRRRAEAAARSALNHATRLQDGLERVCAGLLLARARVEVDALDPNLDAHGHTAVVARLTTLSDVTTELTAVLDRT